MYLSTTIISKLILYFWMLIALLSVSPPQTPCFVRAKTMCPYLYTSKTNLIVGTQ
jgi:hypothetical protein